MRSEELTRRQFASVVPVVLGSPATLGAADSGDAVGEIESSGRTDAATEGPAPTRRLVLDAPAELVGTLPTGTEPTYFYRYENPIPGAGGLEVWRNDSRVTDASRAVDAIENFVWLEVLRDLRPERRRLQGHLGTVLEDTRRLERVLTRVERALQSAVDRLDSFEGRVEIDVGLESMDLWEALTRAYPSIGALDSAIRRAHRTVEAWLREAGEVQRTVPPLKDLLATTDDPANADLDEAAERIRSATDSLAGLEDESTTLIAAVERIQENANRALEKLDQSDDRVVSALEETLDADLGLVSDVVDRGLSTFTDGLRDLVDLLFRRVVEPALEPVRDHREELRTTLDTLRTSPPPTDRRARLERAWTERKDAGLVVSVAMTGIGFLGLLALFGAWVPPVEEG